MPDSRELQALRKEVGELKGGTLRLAEQVEHLSSTLVTVNKIRRDQNTLKKTVADVKESSVSTEDLEAERAERILAHKKTRRRQILTGVLVLALVILMIAVAGSYYSFRNESYSVCQDRSAQADRVRTYLLNGREQALRQAKDTKQRIQIIQGTEQLLAAFPKVSCNSLKPKFPIVH